jgi:ATP-binding cassette subfamily B protein
MSMHAMAGGGGGAWSGMKSLRRDTSVKHHQIAKGTIKRIFSFSRPYRSALIVFLIAVVVDAAIVSVNPLILRAIIDRGIIGHNEGLVITLAVTVAGIALADAALSIVQRWISAVIGERLIYDMRARVFAHIQEMPIAFFSRTQTGALISRLNNDIIGAQQAFTDLLSNVVGNIILVAITLAAMFVLSWPITLAALLLLPVFLIPARRMGQKLGTLMREGFGLNAEMNQMMTERFNVSGAMLAKLYGDPNSESSRFNAKAGRVRDIGITQAAYQRIFFVCLTLTASLATAFVYGFGGVAALHGELMIGTLVALTAYLGRLYCKLT